MHSALGEPAGGVGVRPCLGQGYLKELHGLNVDRKLEVSGFLFSGAGNDVVGEGSDGTPALERILRPFDENQPIAWHIETPALTDTLAFIEKAYLKVLGDIDREFPASKFPKLKVILHGYDRVPTRGSSAGNRRILDEAISLVPSIMTFVHAAGGEPLGREVLQAPVLTRMSSPPQVSFTEVLHLLPLAAMGM